jgi:YVTN family beta-propeller protein
MNRRRWYPGITILIFVLLCTFLYSQNTTFKGFKRETNVTGIKRTVDGKGWIRSKVNDHLSKKPTFLYHTNSFIVSDDVSAPFAPQVSGLSYDPDAPINLSPSSGSPHISDGRALGDILMTIDLAAIGVPVAGYAGAGLTWDGTYLYYENQFDHTIYVIDPTGPSVVTSWSTGLTHPWGVGAETNMWVTDAVGIPGLTEEFTFAGAPTGNSFNGLVGGATWMGDASEWWAAGEIWIVAVGGSNKIYKFSVPGGVLLDSLSDPTWTAISQRALTYDPYKHTFWIGGWNDAIVWEINANTGAVLRQFPFDDISGLAYDWQSALHPTPVLWLATNALTDYIYMIDPDNPPPSTYDIGVISIDAPPSAIMPSTVLDPTATFRNFGAFDENFDVYFDIDTNGAPFYNDLRNITVASGAESTVTFNSCTFGDVPGFTYDITVYNVLGGDEYTANDTLAQQTIIDATFWEILDPPLMPVTSSGHSMATAHDGFIYVFGIHPSTGYSDTFLLYDIHNDLWLDGGNALTASAYGTANYCNGRFYKIGGTNVWPTPLTAVDIYDPAGGTWSSGTPSPTGLLDHCAGVYNDSLIFTFGNGNWSVTPTNEVYLYDTYNDSWTAATSFPGTARGACAGGVIDSFAIIACGYLSTGAYGNDYIVGIIDPTNPANITWGSWATIPVMASGRYRVPSGVDDISEPAGERQLYVICGQNGPFADTYSYNPFTDTWTDYSAPKPAPVGNVTPIVVATTDSGDVGVFVSGGYDGSYIGDNEVFHTGKFTVPVDHDVGVSTIDVPAGNYVTPLSTIAPEATVVNYGQNLETFDVTCEIDSAGTTIYTDTQIGVVLDVGNSTPVTFVNWTAGPMGNTYTIRFYTQLVGDERPSNDLRSKTFNTGSFWIFYDDGSSEANYSVGTFNNDKFAVRFTPLLSPFDCESIAIYHSLNSDAGFCYWDYVQVCPDQAGLPDTSDPDTVLYNVGSDSPPQWLYLRPNVTNISTTDDIWIIIHWNNSPDITYYPLMGSDASSPEGRSWWYDDASGWNQWLSHDWMIGIKHIPSVSTDVQVVCVDNPYAPGFIAASTFSPVVTVKNNGDGNENFSVTFEIDSSGVNVYTSTMNANGMSPGEQRQITFAPFTAPPLYEGPGYSMRVYTQLSGDMRTFNDTISKALDANQRVMVLIQDSDAWTYASNQEVLNTYGVPFGMYTRWKIGDPNVDLSQFSKVVITNDQINTFYSIVQANNAWFENYVNNGGYLEMHTADGSWRAGYWDTLNPLPGNYFWNQIYVDSVYIKLPRHIILNTPFMIMNPELGSWNYVTHGYYTTVPANTDTALIADDGVTTYGPSLTIHEIPLGADTGLYIYSGLTEEWSWYYGYSNILANTLLYPPILPLSVELTTFTGKYTHKGVVLTWKTESEEDNFLWKVDRKDGSGEWETVGSVPSGGNSPSGHRYEFIDGEVLPEKTYTYRLGDVNSEGNCTWRMEVVVYTRDYERPKVFALGKNYPNPFTSRTTVQYQVPRKAEVSIDIYDVSGRLVKSLVRGTHNPGYYQVIWNGDNDQKRTVASGLYFCRMSAGSYTKIRRMLRF